MDLTSVTLPCTLLPTCFLICMLSFLCTYFCRRYHQVPEIPSTHQEPEILSTPRTAVSQEDEKPRRNPLLESHFVVFDHFGPMLCGREIKSFFSDPSHINLVEDMYRASLRLGQAANGGTDFKYLIEDDGASVGEILELLEYRAMPAAKVFKLLQDPRTRQGIMSHILVTVGIDKTSLDTDQQSSLLPPSTDVHNFIISYIQSQFEILRGMKSLVPRHVFQRMMRIPAPEGIETDWPVENRDKLYELFCRLFLTYRGDNIGYNSATGEHHYKMNAIKSDLDDFVYLRYLMLASTQQMEFRWPEVTDTYFPAVPDIYAISGEDGVLLDEPKLCWSGRIIDIPCDGLDGSTLGRW